jgi:hypothetical protein
MATAAGIRLPEREPLLHFSRGLSMRAWWLVRVQGQT